ncbi:MAG: FAD-dependent oxidoreductase [Thermaerobacter sp.]|nr:FAD-dependent oxidoreductase [Thermaerobacter sp.]
MVVVVGAGATGLGVAWDLVLRGVPVTVVDAGDLGHGTSGRFHGLLHSGGRYVVSDVAAARECWQENQILRRIAPSAVEDTGGFFIEGADEEGDFAAEWVAGCRAVGLPVSDEAPARLRGLVPEVRRDLRRVFRVPDAVLEGFRLLHLLRRNIVKRGGVVLTHTRVARVDMTGGRVVGVDMEGPGGRDRIACDVLVNAAGPWAGTVSQLYGDPIPLQLGGGLMLIFANRHTPVVVNRLSPPGDGDILVPHQSVAIFGTTDVRQDDPEPPPVTRAEVLRLMASGRAMFPTMDSWRVLRAFTGVRPLYQPADGKGEAGSRRVTRDFTVIDRVRDAGVVAVVGGKFTTFRAMAERTADVVARQLGVSAPSRTRTQLLEAGVSRAADSNGPVVCECEDVATAALAPMTAEPLSAWRTPTWLAMGPCQGTFCLHRAAGLRRQRASAAHVAAEVGALRTERDRGFTSVLWGANAQEWALNRAVRAESLGEALP